MGRFHHSKKAYSEGKRKKNNKFAISKTGNKKLDDDFVYTQTQRTAVRTFLISAKVFLICVIWAISGTISNIIPDTI
jgi:hypothetical protein